MATIIALTNQKGGVGKTTTCENLGVGLAQAGKKVLLIDGDPQGSLTISLGHPQPDKLPFTLSDAMGRILMDEPLRPGEGILHHPEGVDLMPADIQLSGMEVSLVNAMSRETILRQYLDTLKGQYSHILIDCQPSLGKYFENLLIEAVWKRIGKQNRADAMKYLSQIMDQETQKLEPYFKFWKRTEIIDLKLRAKNYLIHEVITNGYGTTVMPYVPSHMQMRKLCYMMTITYQTIEASRYGLFLSVIRQGLFFIPFILTLPRFFGVMGIYLSQPAADVLTILVCLLSVRSMKAAASRNMSS